MFYVLCFRFYVSCPDGSAELRAEIGVSNNVLGFGFNVLG
jgi:hypothetical protein